MTLIDFLELLKSFLVFLLLGLFLLERKKRNKLEKMYVDHLKHQEKLLEKLKNLDKSGKILKS